MRNLTVPPKHMLEDPEKSKGKIPSRLKIGIFRQLAPFTFLDFKKRTAQDAPKP